MGPKNKTCSSFPMAIRFQIIWKTSQNLKELFDLILHWNWDFEFGYYRLYGAQIHISTPCLVPWIKLKYWLLFVATLLQPSLHNKILKNKICKNGSLNKSLNLRDIQFTCFETVWSLLYFCLDGSALHKPKNKKLNFLKKHILRIRPGKTCKRASNACGHFQQIMWTFLGQNNSNI